MTQIEQMAAWRIHRAAADAARASGGHFTCSTEIGFIAVAERFGLDDGELQPKPCTRCLGLWQAAKKARSA